MICGTGLFNVTELFAVFVESVVSVAVIVTRFDGGGNSGAVYTPAVEIVPMLALPPGVPFTAQLTGVEELPATCAVKV